ncbi:MAG: hypothetical protein HQ510_12750 [Candidatus Marinimicrobia bacterium]|nr:hypothetical protein [Candidatus Neomarinimicrobiota bacterium]
MNKLFYIIIVLFTIISCNTTDKITEEEKQEIQLQQKKDKLISEITDKYNISYDWDTLTYKYSINYDKILKSGYQLIRQIWVKDIYQKDGSYYISIRTGYSPTFYFDLSISEENLNKLLRITYYGLKFGSFEGLLVVEISEIKKIRFKIESYEDDEKNLSLELDASGSFIGKGKIVELIMNGNYE